jgi:multidrug efflux system membrane fusion protein
MPNPPEPEVRHKPSRGLKIAGLAAAALAVVVVATGLIGRASAKHQLTTTSASEAIPTVSVIRAGVGGAQTLVLPGQVQAFYNATIHSRVSGYLTHWYQDIGASVKAGQVLATIETPELDQQLARADADLATAQANAQLAKTTANRWAGLLAQDAVSRQESDEKAGDLAARTSLVRAAKAQVDQYRVMEAFKTIRAPFAGIVTARNTDVGALIAAGSPSDPGLFTVSDVHRLRVYVKAPQSYSAEIKPGMTATLTVPEFPGRTFTAVVSTTSGAIGEQTGTVLVELQLDNPDHALKPGEFSQVRFNLPSGDSFATVPASATMFRRSGLSVATVGPGNRVIIKPITVAKDLGSAVEVSSGLAPGDRIIDNPPDSLDTGDLVKVADPGPGRLATADAPPPK